VHFIDVGQGDALLIVAPDGKVALIDGGESGTGVLAYLQAQGVKRINLMIATHPHADHIGGLIDVLRALPVDEVVTNGQSHTTLAYERFLDAIMAAKAVYTEVKRGDTLTLGGLNLDVLHPQAPEGDNLNDQSVVLRLLYGTVAFLVTGDAECIAEADMLAAGETVRAQILKVGHHGSRSASSPAFLAAVQPEVAVYSSGAANSYGHPHVETLAALANVGTTVYGADVNGTVIITSDGTGYQVEMAELGLPRGPPATVVTGSTLVPVPGLLSLAVVSLTSPVSPGTTARLTIKTMPGAACTITVYYKSGPSQAAGLGSQNADDNGVATWQWRVGAGTTPGIWRIVVTATGDAGSTELEIPLEVRR
jgi:beta-lactamase superfamily II metal-dependent hydrolase